MQCGETHNLQVHHLTYENRGYEYRTHETDLVTLCKDCHSALHNKTLKKVKSHKPVKIKRTLKGLDIKGNKTNERLAVEIIR